MNCYKCATPIPDNSRFCLSCGADVSGEGHVHERTLAVEADPELMMKLQADIGTEYVVEKELGRGGMAIVYLGRDAQLGRKVAVKLLPPELTYAAGSGVIERFKREARTSATLDHPHIIPVYRVSQGQKLFWYVMKFLEGESLDHILEREGQLPVERVAAILKQTADALDYAHQHQVIHRDIKPANIMIDSKGRCTVTDFGIAKALDANTLTATGSMIGTPYYMSPEQCSGKRVAAASDQYALGVMVYQMLGGHVPFTGESLIDIVRKHCMDPVPPLGILRPNLPAPLVAVVEKALAKSPEDRFATATDFAAAFEAAARGADVSLTAPGVAPKQRLSKTALVSPIPGAVRTAKGKMAGGRRWAAAAAALVVLGGGAAVVVLKPWAADAPAETPAAPGTVLPPSGTALVVADSATRAPGASLAPQDSAKSDSAPVEPPIAAAATPRPAEVAPGRLTISNLPPGGVITRNGQRVRGTRLTLEPNRNHTIRVEAPGYVAFSYTARLTPGEQQMLPLAMQRQPAGVAVTNPPPSQPQGATGTPPGPAGSPGTTPALQPAAAAPGRITVGTRPSSASITINGRTAPTNPVSNFEVAAGPARIVFRWNNANGAPQETTLTVTVPAGELLNLRYITLRMTP